MPLYTQDTPKNIPKMALNVRVYFWVFLRLSYTGIYNVKGKKNYYNSCIHEGKCRTELV